MEDRLKELEEPKIKDLPEFMQLRAWHKVDKQFYYLKYSKLCSKSAFNYGCYGWVGKDQDYPIQSPFNCKSQWETPQRPTGLKDKDGNLIYEGDLLWNLDYPDDAYVLKVVWDKEYCRFRVEHYIGSGEFENMCDTDDILESIHFYELAGNIYETPELLEA
jgi:hypothetical protein